MATVYCTTHNPRGTEPVAHKETPECAEAHYADRPQTYATPSMTAAETLDPREAIYV